MSSGGYVRLYRSSLENPLFRKPSVWHFWQYCLLKATWKRESVLWKGERIKLKPGSFVSSLRDMTRETGLSLKKIRTAILTLTKHGNLAHETAQQGTLINVIKWEEFQGNGKQEGTPEGTPRAHQGHKRPPEPLPHKASGASKQESRNEYNNSDSSESPSPPFKKNSADPRVNHIIDFYFRQYKERFGSSPVINGGGDGKILKSLFAVLDYDIPDPGQAEEEMRRLLSCFLSSGDEFYKKTGFTIRGFKTAFPGLRLQNRRRQDPIDRLLKQEVLK